MPEPLAHSTWILKHSISLDATRRQKSSMQVTPLLGMLRDIQYAEKAAAIADQKLGEQHTYIGLPRSVNLIWAVRNRSKLQLLDQDLLTTAA